MRLTGKFNIFVEDKKTDKGTIKVFSTTIGHKQEDGTYVNATMGVRFGKQYFPLERLNKLSANKCYVFSLVEAWLDVRGFVTKEGKQGREIFIHIEKADPVEVKDIKAKGEEVSDDLPF